MEYFNVEIKNDEYTKKAQALYSKLNIARAEHLSINEVANEYQQLLHISLKNGIKNLEIYTKR